MPAITGIWPDYRPPLRPEGELLAGWWCPPGTGRPLRVLVNPWGDRAAVEDAEARVWAACQALLPGIAAALGGPDEEWWCRVLMPYLVHVVSAIEDRVAFLSAGAAVAPEAPVVCFRAAAPAESMGAGIERLRSALHNRALISMLAVELDMPRIPADRADEEREEDTQPSEHADLRSRLLSAPAVLAAVAGQRTLGRWASRRGPDVSVLGHAGLSAAQAVALRRRSAARVIRPAPPATAVPGAVDEAARARLAAAGRAGNDLAALSSRILPRILPRSLVEHGGELASRASDAFGPPTHLLVAAYGADELMNAHIAACAGAGRQIDHVQHGGFYLQARVNAQERLEIREGSNFLSWRETPSPLLERRRGTHRGGRDIVIVEGLNPPDRYVIRFASTPLGDQGYESSQLLGRLVEAVRHVPEHLRLRRFPTSAPGAWRPRSLARLPHHPPLGARTACDWLRRARMAVVAYPDTPFVEAMILGVPLLGLWNPDHWDLRDDAVAPFEALAAAGVLFSDPEAAARHLDEVYDRADEWWAGEAVRAARDEFIARFAPPGDWLAAWSAHIRSMHDR